MSLAHATLQGDYLNIYLKINDAEHLEKQGDYRGALEDFKDCYARLAKIHESDPNWETALVVHRMADCKAKILELEPEAAAQQPDMPPTPATTTNSDNGTTPPTPPVQPESSDDVAALKLQLQAVKQELAITKQNLKDSQAQLETYRVQLDTVNTQLAALKNQQTVDDRMGKLMSDNKALTDKLAAAQAEIEEYKTNPKSKLAMAQAQLKNLQDQYDASQAANKALQDTTTNLKQQLDQANADLIAANQKLAAAGPGSPEYDTLKRENEIMRDILTRELQEQAHRDMAKRLAQEEFDNLKLKSKVLQEQLDILGSPMTPPTNDQERALLASLKVPGPDVAPPDANSGNSFTANVTGASTPPDPAAPATNAAAATDPAVGDTNTATATATPPATNNTASTAPASTNTVAAGTTAPPSTTDDTTNQPPVNIVMNNQAPGNDDAPAAPTQGAPTTGAALDPPSTNAPASVTPPATPPATPDAATPPAAPASNNTPDPNAPIPPNAPTGQPTVPTTTTNSVTPPAPPTTPAPTGNTTTKLPPATTVYQDTTIKHNNAAAKQPDPTIYSAQPRLPDDMQETAQDAADLFKNQKYDESAAKYQTIIDKYPESLYAWSNLGVVRFQQGKFDEALKALQQAVKLSPTDAFSYSNLGIVYYQLNQYENAIDALNSAEALDPNDAKTHNYLGCAESQKGWQEASEKEFRKAIEIDPNFGDAHFNLALVYATSKPPSLELARREYNRALELGIARDARLEKLLQGTQH
ncbi:MAG: tetratricopeptide repeat protein [Methylacidiphilales bacterium]|nr:tetratricopeptide repeat protein [Candidatus Methylacidiphilales bacterium]